MAVGGDTAVGTSFWFHALFSGILPAQTPELTMLMGKRAPSSLFEKISMLVSVKSVSM